MITKISELEFSGVFFYVDSYKAGNMPMKITNEFHLQRYQDKMKSIWGDVTIEFDNEYNQFNVLDLDYASRARAAEAYRETPEYQHLVYMRSFNH